MTQAADLKAALRAHQRALRAELAAAAPDAGERAAAHLPTGLLGRFPVVAGYRPIQDEIDPTPVLVRLAEAGATVTLSVTPPKGDDAPLRFRRWTVGGPLQRGAFGTQEPPESEPELDPDLIVAPLVAFDRHGFRLGYGKGHFDRTVASLSRRRARPYMLGLAYAGQEVERVLAEPFDERLDAILTERAYIPVHED